MSSSLIATVGATVLFLMSDAALAATPTPFQQAELAQLSPTIRSQVEARMSGKQKIRGILETMLLNSISGQFAAKRVVAVDFEIGIATVEGNDGRIMTFPFDIPTLIVKN